MPLGRLSCCAGHAWQALSAMHMVFQALLLLLLRTSRLSSFDNARISVGVLVLLKVFWTPSSLLNHQLHMFACCCCCCCCCSAPSGQYC
jgi:hypothetical protein